MKEDGKRKHKVLLEKLLFLSKKYKELTLEDGYELFK